MSVRLSALVFALTVLATPLPVAAQSGIELSAYAGVAGVVDPVQPVSITVEVTAGVLFTGTIEVVHGGVGVRAPAEVPAGSTKTFTLTAPPPSGPGYKVNLLEDGSADPLASTTVTVKSPGYDKLLVGVSGVPDVVAVLERVRTAIGAVPIDPVDFGSEPTPGPVRYLAVGPAYVPDDEVRGWVRSGGRLIVPAGGEVDLGLPLDPLGLFPGTSVAWYAAGQGEVLSGTDLSESDWSAILRPVPITTLSNSDFGTLDGSLTAAASNGGNQRIPSLPWLIGALVGYAVLVGPVAFIILGRMQRRELAWVAIPILSVIALGGFWIAGSQRLESTVVSHATVVLATPDGTTLRSAVVIAAGQGGRHSVRFPGEPVVYPSRADQFFAAPSGLSVGPVGTVEGSDVSFDLPQLGFASVQVIQQGSIRASAVPSVEGGVVSVTVENSSDLKFTAWGAVQGRQARVAGGELAPGASGSIDLSGGVGFEAFGANIGDFVVQERQLWDDPLAWQVYSPLGDAARRAAGDADGFAFGFTDDLSVQVAVDGRETSVSGPAIVVIPFEATVDTGASTGRLVSAGDGFIDTGFPGSMVNGSEMLVDVAVPPSASESLDLAYSQDFGPVPPVLEAWNWGSSGFERIEVGRLDQVFVAANGEIVIRAAYDDKTLNQIEGIGALAPASVTVTWA